MNLPKVMWLVLCLLLASIALPDNGATDENDKNQYACPMHCNNAVYDEPGTCPVCGMDLVEENALRERDKNRIKVAILLFDGVQIIDYTAPYEVFGQAGFDVFTVSHKQTAITTSMNMKVQPHYSLSSAPKPNVLLVPGGTIDSAEQNPEIIQWIRKSAAEADHVLSVCNGAFLLAKAGLLDGLTATTFHRLIGNLKQAAPKTKIVSDKRYVDNGKIITSAGLTSGMDASLYLVSKIKGKGEAQQLALHMEYNWQPDSNYARAALADLKLPNLHLQHGEWQFIKTAGDANHWEIEGKVVNGGTPADVQNKISNAMQRENWKQTQGKGNEWTRTDADGTWKLIVSVAPVSTGVIVKAQLHKERPTTAGLEEAFMKNSSVQK